MSCKHDKMMPRYENALSRGRVTGSHRHSRMAAEK
jgi:hypothetical protein